MKKLILCIAMLFCTSSVFSQEAGTIEEQSIFRKALRLPKWKSIDPEAARFPSMSPYNLYGCNPILNVDKKGDIITTFPLANTLSEVNRVVTQYQLVYKGLKEMISKSPELQKVVAKAESANTRYDVYLPYKVEPYTKEEMSRIGLYSDIEEVKQKVVEKPNLSITGSGGGNGKPPTIEWNFETTNKVSWEYGLFSRNYGYDIFWNPQNGFNYHKEGRSYNVNESGNIADIFLPACPDGTYGYNIIQFYDELAHSYFPGDGDSDHVAMYSLLLKEFDEGRLVIKNKFVAIELRDRWILHKIIDKDDEMYKKITTYIHDYPTENGDKSNE
jgi:hypothetical protein